MVTASDRQLVELDNRRRASLAKIGRKADTRYLVTEYPNGDLYLTPVDIVSKRTLELLADPEALAALEAGVADVHAGRVSPFDLAGFEAGLNHSE